MHSAPFLLLLVASLGAIMAASTRPNLYEYYTQPEIKTGLSTGDRTHFRLNNKTIAVLSGAVHYFRVPRAYWRDRLRKLRAAGLNTVETYVPWNLHEYQEGVYDFGNGGSDFEQFLDIEGFLRMAQEEDLFVIVRPGPYICSEWDFGGMPSWLLRYKDMKIRTSDETFLSLVARYFKVLLAILAPLQFTRGGPIIAFQIENEYGNVKLPDKPIDLAYLERLKAIFEEDSLTELLFTSDTPSNGNSGAIPHVLNTANFQNDSKKELDLLKTYQPDKPAMVMEFWSGWFDHWGEKHHVLDARDFTKELETVLTYPASVNFYMFHGGTNWGFMNGANILDNGETVFDTSSYDYDAPLSEDGGYTEKYHTLKKLIETHNPVKLSNPRPPETVANTKYNTVEIMQQLKLSALIDQLSSAGNYENPPAMELLDINNRSGQSYGYIIYRKRNLHLPANSTLSIKGKVRDTLMILLNGKPVTKPPHSYNDLDDWKTDTALNNPDLNNATLDLIVENWGRVNYGKLHQFDQRKGLHEATVHVNGNQLTHFDVYPLEFKTNWLNTLTGWNAQDATEGPTFYKTQLNLEGDLADTYLDLRKWVKGVVVVNGFVLSRYFRAGPQQSVYLPAPFLRNGVNDILIFEHFVGGGDLSFSDVPIYETLEHF